MTERQLDPFTQALVDAFAVRVVRRRRNRSTARIFSLTIWFLLVSAATIAAVSYGLGALA